MGGGEVPSLSRGKLKGLLDVPFSCARMYTMSCMRISRSTKQVCKFYWNSSTLYPLCINLSNCRRQRANGEKRSYIKAESSRKLINLLLSYNFILVVSLITHIYNPIPHVIQLQLTCTFQMPSPRKLPC